MVVTVSGSGNALSVSAIRTERSTGRASFTLKSTQAEVKTVSVRDSSPYNSDGPVSKTVTFTAPASPAGSSPTSSSGTSTQKKTAASPETPAQPGAPAVPVLESLKVGNTQFAADKIQDHEFRQNEKKIFSGKTIPNGVVHLYFHSDPFEATATADKDGNWTYELTKDIGDGSHELQVAVTDPATNKTSEKSAPVKFVLVAEAKAVTVQTKDIQNKPTSQSYFYLIGGFAAIILISGGIESYLFFAKGKGFLLKRVFRKHPKAQI